MNLVALGQARPRADWRYLARIVAGLLLIGGCWAISWSRLRPISDFTFFPLWLGYILAVDALVEWRSRTSLIARSGWRVVWLFLLSAPLWWTFELLNRLVGNWIYHEAHDYGRVARFLLSSLAFSTVMPVVLTTAELVRSFRLGWLRSLPAMPMTRGWLIGYHLARWLMVLATAVWPDYAFPLVWLAHIFIIDPIGTALGARSIGRYLARRDWSIVLNVAVGTLICGFFWEMWNIRAMPKWTYDIPHVDWLHIFEMPILGYGGYLPFGVEVYAFYALGRWIVERAGVMRFPEARVASEPAFRSGATESGGQVFCRPDATSSPRSSGPT